MSWVDVPSVQEKVPAGRRVLRQIVRQRPAGLQRVAAPAGGHYVAVGPVSAAYPRLNMVDAEVGHVLHDAAVHAAVLIAREELQAVHFSLAGITPPVNLPDRGRRMIFERLTKFLDTEESVAMPSDVPPRLTFQALEGLRMSRSRERILTNLEEMYREAFERAKETADPAAMASLDFAYRREQLYFEILLDVRDAIEKK